MTININALPAFTAQPWYDYASTLDLAVRELQAVVTLLVPVTGSVISVNGVTPDVAGDVSLTAADVSAMPDGYAPSLSDAPAQSVFVIKKDTVTGFWPASWDANGHPVYSGGAANAGVRPIARSDLIFEWEGVDPPPASVVSGTGGILRGVDRRVIPG